MSTPHDMEGVITRQDASGAWRIEMTGKDVLHGHLYSMWLHPRYIKGFTPAPGVKVTLKYVTTQSSSLWYAYLSTRG